MTNALPNISSVKVTQGDGRQRANLVDRVRFPACLRRVRMSWARVCACVGISPGWCGVGLIAPVAFALVVSLYDSAAGGAIVPSG